MFVARWQEPETHVVMYQVLLLWGMQQGCPVLPKSVGQEHETHVVMFQVLLRWGLQQGCAVLPKSVRQERIAEFAPDKLLSWELNREDMDALAALDDGTKLCWDPKDVV
jgi:diketogulonate reductase-like aldo/keto reductase